MNKTTTELQKRLDHLRWFQACHHLRIGKLTAALKGRPQNPGQLREELIKQNEEMESALTERTEIEGILRDIRRDQSDLKEARANVRQLVAAMLANPELVENDHASLVHDAAQVECLIQALQFS